MSIFWKVPALRDPDDMMTKAVQILKRVEPNLPVYHTRQMRRDFAKKVSIIDSTVPKHLIRSVYSELTSDASADQNPAIDERVRQAILGEDPDLVIDLRHLNKGRPQDTFAIFFEELDKEIEHITAADERRHGVAHLAEFISVRDLIEKVAKKCPPDTLIPSESTVLFAFVPKNSQTSVAKLYKSKVDLKFKVQSRQLRSSHPDDHYCAALFKYMRCFAVKYRHSTTFLCVDDKSKIDFGEPGLAMSSGVRGKKSLVPVSALLGALDHDQQQKGSLTPSVYLNVEIPETVEDTFYRGQVSVLLKDSVFQPSTAFRHAVEMESLLRNEDVLTPFLIIYSDGGPDHRITYEGVKLSLAAVFRALDLDLLIAGRTAPGHSWANPVERIMSVLNLAFQNTALSREQCSGDVEQILRTCDGMQDIRNKANRVERLKDEWSASVKPIQDLLEDRITRVQLKGRPFCVLKPASDDAIRQMQTDIIDSVDASIEMGKYQKKDMAKKQDYKAFMAKHCRERNYIVQFRKCEDRACCRPLRSTESLPEWIPDPLLSADQSHYQSFETLFGQETTEQDMPSEKRESLASIAESQQVRIHYNRKKRAHNFKWSVEGKITLDFI